MSSKKSDEQGVQHGDISQTIANIKTETIDMEMEKLHSNIELKSTTMEVIKKENVALNEEKMCESNGALEEETNEAFRNVHGNSGDMSLPVIVNVQSLKNKYSDIPEFSPPVSIQSTGTNVSSDILYGKKPAPKTLNQLIMDSLVSPDKMKVNQTIPKPGRGRRIKSNFGIKLTSINEFIQSKSSSGNKNLGLVPLSSDHESTSKSPNRNVIKLSLEKTSNIHLATVCSNTQNLAKTSIPVNSPKLQLNSQQQKPARIIPNKLNTMTQKQGSIAKLVPIRPNKIPLTLSSSLPLKSPCITSMSAGNPRLPAPSNSVSFRPALHVQQPTAVRFPIPANVEQIHKCVILRFNRDDQMSPAPNKKQKLLLPKTAANNSSHSGTEKKSKDQLNQLQTRTTTNDRELSKGRKPNKDQDPTDRMPVMMKHCSETTEKGVRRKKAQSKVQPSKRLKKIPITKTAITLDLTGGSTCSICIECDQPLSSTYHAVLKNCDMCSFSTICSVSLCNHLKLKHAIKLKTPEDLGSGYGFLPEGLLQAFMICECQGYWSQNRNQMAYHLSKCASGQGTCSMKSFLPECLIQQDKSKCQTMYIKSEVKTEDFNDNPTNDDMTEFPGTVEQDNGIQKYGTEKPAQAELGKNNAWKEDDKFSGSDEQKQQNRDDDDVSLCLEVFQEDMEVDEQTSEMYQDSDDDNMSEEEIRQNKLSSNIREHWEVDEELVDKGKLLCCSTKDDIFKSIVRCTVRNCCNSQYHCPLCSSFQPSKPSKVRRHIDLSHWKHRIENKDICILKCYDKCRIKPHYHCNSCSNTILNKSDMLKHLKLHSSVDHDPPATNNTDVAPDDNQENAPHPAETVQESAATPLSENAQEKEETKQTTETPAEAQIETEG